MRSAPLTPLCAVLLLVPTIDHSMDENCGIRLARAASRPGRRTRFGTNSPSPGYSGRVVHASP